jgi:FixJ family two-component response regulator
VVAEPVVSIIEDDESLRSALVGLLRLHGYRATSHGSAEEFLGSGHLNDAHCIITDVQMPGLSGIGLKEWLVSREYRTPVIMITARTESIIQEQAAACGAFCLLRKPFAVQALMECLDRALSN